MKFPSSNSRAVVVLRALLSQPATIHQGIERHSLLGVGEQKIREIYERLEVDGHLVKKGVVYEISQRARDRLMPTSNGAPVVPPTEPAYRGNWHGSLLTAASARRSGAAFGLNFRQ